MARIKKLRDTVGGLFPVIDLSESREEYFAISLAKSLVDHSRAADMLKNRLDKEIPQWEINYCYSTFHI